MNGEGLRGTTVEERQTWGECPICKAAHGEFCRPEVGIPLGQRVDGLPFQRGDGAHQARIQRAPLKVMLVGVWE